MLRLGNNLIIFPYRDDGRIMFCINNPEQIAIGGEQGVTLRSGFSTPQDAAKWAGEHFENLTHSKADAKMQDSSLCPFVSAYQQKNKKGENYVA